MAFRQVLKQLQPAASLGYNLFSVAFIAFVSISLLTNHFKTQAQPSERASLGDKVAVPSIDWRQNRRTLVIATSAGCADCDKAVAFYRALLSAPKKRPWHAVVVSSEREAAAGIVIDAASASPEAVTFRQLRPESIGITSLPTLFVVDEAGRLMQQWIGSLSSYEEDDVAAILGIGDWSDRAEAFRSGEDRRSGIVSPIVSSSELRAMLDTRTPINLIDVRERDEFARRHLDGAVNIPSDELPVRLPHEMQPEAPTVLYCNFSAACAAEGAPSLCSDTVEALRRIGLTNVRVIRDPIAILDELGFGVKGSDSAIKR